MLEENSKPPELAWLPLVSSLIAMLESDSLNTNRIRYGMQGAVK